nr:hypothetical protein [Tanacetum cinerariifolium]
MSHSWICMSMYGFVAFAEAYMLIKSPISVQHNETPNQNLVQLLKRQSQESSNPTQIPSSPDVTPKEEPITLDRTKSLDPFLPVDQDNRVEVDYSKLIWEGIIHKLNKKTREKVVPYPRFISLLLEYMIPHYKNEDLIINPNQVPQGKKPRSKSGLKRKQSSKHTYESKTKASKSKTDQSNEETRSSSAKDKSPSHASGSTLVVPELHKETQQAADGPTFLEATSEERSHPQLSSGMSAFINNEPVYSAFFTLHSEVWMNLSVLVNQTKSTRDGLKTTHTDLDTNEESRSNDILKKIKLKDLSDLIKDTKSTFFTLDSLTNKPIIVTDESEEDEAKKHKETHDASHNETKDTLASHPPSPKSVQLQEPKDQVSLLQSQNLLLLQQKQHDEAKIASLKAQPRFPNVNQLVELLVTSLKPELSNLLASHDFASSIPNELKELPSKITTLSGEIQELKRHIQ